MKNILKLCLLLTLCAALLLTAGCAKKDTESTTGTTEGANQGQTEDIGATDNTTGAEVDATDEGNPEGDPFDAMTDPDDSGNGGSGTANPKPTEPDVGVEEGTEPSEDDFEIDFGDLL